MMSSYGPIEDWDVSNVTDMSHMFSDCTAFNCDLSKWDVSNVTDMTSMFFHCKAFNCDLSKWDVSNVTGMAAMFYDCKAFNCDLSKWDVSNVKDMRYMFCNCKAFNCSLSAWENRHWECMIEQSPLNHPKTMCTKMFHGADAFGEALPPALLERMRRDELFHRNGRWLWRLASRRVRAHVLMRLLAYHLLERASRPDAEGNAPRGAIHAFREDFRY